MTSHETFPRIALDCEATTPTLKLFTSEKNSYNLTSLDDDQKLLIPTLLESRVLIANPIASPSGANLKYPTLRLTLSQTGLASICIGSTNRSGDEDIIVLSNPIKQDSEEQARNMLAALKNPALDGSEITWITADAQARFEMFGSQPYAVALCRIREEENGEPTFVERVPMNEIPGLTPESDAWIDLLPRYASSMQEVQDIQDRLAPLVEKIQSQNKECLYQIAAAAGLTFPATIKQGGQIVPLGQAFFQKDGPYDMNLVEIYINQDTNSLSASLAQSETGRSPEDPTLKWDANFEGSNMWYHRKDPQTHYLAIGGVDVTINPSEPPIPCVLYIGQKSRIAWLRPKDDFLDGRFTKLTSSLS